MKPNSASHSYHNIYHQTRFRAFLIVLLGSFFLSACSIHSIDLQQGNVITQENLAQLSPGMTKKQVSLLLGTPLINDPFHVNRWDYVYRFVEGSSGEVQDAHITLVFNQDDLNNVIVHKTPPLEDDIKTPTLIRQ